jgi:hypothetical protein
MKVSGSVIHFDASNPEVEKFADAKGWNAPGEKVALTQGDAIYSTDNWQTTKSAPLQYLQDDTQGAVLQDVSPGTPVSYAVHANVGMSQDGFQTFSDKADTWFNNGGWNYEGVTGQP